MKEEYSVVTIDGEPERISKSEAYALFDKVRRDLYDEDVENEFYERCEQDDIDLEDISDEKIAEALKPLQNAYAEARQNSDGHWRDLLVSLMDEAGDEDCRYKTILAKLGISIDE